MPREEKEDASAALDSDLRESTNQDSGSQASKEMLLANQKGELNPCKVRNAADERNAASRTPSKSADLSEATAVIAEEGGRFFASTVTRTENAERALTACGRRHLFHHRDHELAVAVI
jgi:hypothetical protein